MTTPIDRESVEQLADDELLAQLNAYDPYDDEFRRRFLALRAALDEAEARAASAAQEARAVALQEAMGICVNFADTELSAADAAYAAGYCDGADRCAHAILALLDTPAAEALERMRSEAEARGFRAGWQFAFRQCEATGSVPDPDYAAIRARGETRDLITCSTLDEDWSDAKTYGHLPRKASEGET